MAQIDASGLTFAFSALNQTPVQYFALDDAAADHYSWSTASSGTFYHITALSFDDDITTAPLAGSINTINVTDNSYDPGLSITGLNASLANLIDTGSAAANFEKFWETVLAGATSVILPSQATHFSIMGDYVTVNAGQTRTGAADVFTGNGTSSIDSAVGDALAVDAGATLTGGDDTFHDVSASYIIGDVGNPDTASPNNLGTVNGGNDTIELTDPGYSPSIGATNVVGDVFYNGAGGVSNGGDDSITFRNMASASIIVGDDNIDNGSSAGGNDTVLLETTIPGRTLMFTATVAGDDYQVSGSISARGGNDQITLNNANSSVVTGDFVEVDNSVAVGGDDTILIRGTFALTTPFPPYPINPMVDVVTGDANATAGTTAFTGGNDTITLLNTTAAYVVGDVHNSSATGAFSGGDDTISVTFNRANTAAVYNLIGDASLTNSTLFTGGNDTLTLNLLGSQTSIPQLLTGDALHYVATGNGSVNNGNDILTVALASNQPVFLYGDGNDASATGTLTVHDGNDTLTGGSGNDTLYGDTVAESAGGTLSVIGGNDTLDGRGGNDVLNGGLGVDTAVFGLNQSVHVDLNGIAGSAASDLYEAIGQGNDQLIGIENVTGSSQADVIIGDGGANVLDGGGGADLLKGRGGSDTYVVDNAGDKVVELNGEGTDLVKSSVTFSLKGEYVENLTLTGSGAHNGTGNSLANTIIGNGGNNVLDGGTGADTLEGGKGNDTYIVDNAGDKVVEHSGTGTGTDLVKASVSFNLSGEQIENITLTGSGATHSTGNSLANTMIGNSAHNSLNGGSGNDVLDGGLGSDTLTGGTGKDIFVFDTKIGSTNLDTIADFKPGADMIELDRSIFTALPHTGVLAASYFHAGAGAHDGDDHVIYNAATGALFYDADGTGSQAQVQFATLAQNLHVAATDFLVA